MGGGGVDAYILLFGIFVFHKEMIGLDFYLLHLHLFEVVQFVDLFLKEWLPLMILVFDPSASRMVPPILFPIL